jgi:hypothetical protein
MKTTLIKFPTERRATLLPQISSLSLSFVTRSH